MIDTNSRPFIRQRCPADGVRGFDAAWGAAPRRQMGAVPHRPTGGAPRRATACPPIRGELNLGHDFLAGALAEDARSEGRQTWLGLVVAAGAVAVLASGYGLPALAVACCLTPVVGIALEIFSSEE